MTFVSGFFGRRREELGSTSWFSCLLSVTNIIRFADHDGSSEEDHLYWCWLRGRTHLLCDCIPMSWDRSRGCGSQSGQDRCVELWWTADLRARTQGSCREGKRTLDSASTLALTLLFRQGEVELPQKSIYSHLFKVKSASTTCLKLMSASYKICKIVVTKFSLIEFS